jgi:hypothetical protein
MTRSLTMAFPIVFAAVTAPMARADEPFARIPT